MQRKDSDGEVKMPILQALMRRATLPAIKDEQDGVLYQTVLNLSRRHQHNIDVRRKANDAAQQAQRERERQLQRYQQATLRKEQSIEEQRKQQQKDLSALIKREEAHTQEVLTKHRNLQKQERQKVLQEHSLLLSRMESCSTFKQSRTLPHRSASNSLEKSRQIKHKKKLVEMEFAQTVLHQSMEKERSVKRRLMEMEQTRRGNLGKLDQRLEEVQRTMEVSSEKHRQAAAEKYIKSLHGSEMRLKEVLKDRNTQLEMKAKREFDTHQKAVRNCKAVISKHIKEASSDLEQDNSRILRATHHRERLLDEHQHRHRKLRYIPLIRREHENKVIASCGKENDLFLRNKMALLDTTKEKQHRMESLKQELEQCRQQAMVDHFLKRQISSQAP